MTLDLRERRRQKTREEREGSSKGSSIIASTARACQLNSVPGEPRRIFLVDASR